VAQARGIPIDQALRVDWDWSEYGDSLDFRLLPRGDANLARADREPCADLRNAVGEASVHEPVGSGRPFWQTMFISDAVRSAVSKGHGDLSLNFLEEN
jgi:hypothetical protein